MPNPDDRDARITELESRVAQQDHSLLELNDEVYRQQRQIAALEEQLKLLRTRFESLTAREPNPDSGDELPPHY
jgi:SlyX protein